MAENLRTTKYNDGTPIPQVTDAAAWSNLMTPGYCWYNNDAAKYKETYGALYNWYTVNIGNLCPSGWHVPADTEWMVLTAHLGGEKISGGKLKETGTLHWDKPNLRATNETGFTALPGGRCYFSGAIHRLWGLRLLVEFYRELNGSCLDQVHELQYRRCSQKQLP